MFRNRRERNTWKGLVAGAIGGAVASFAMNRFQAGMSKVFAEDGAEGARRKGREAQGWKQRHPASRHDPSEEERSTVKIADAISEAVFHHELEPSGKDRAGAAVHYVYGTGAGALYGLAAEHWDDARMGQGTVFGAALWAVSDEAAVPAMGLSKGPDAYPLRTHAMSLAADLVYGVTTELARRALRRGVLSR